MSQGCILSIDIYLLSDSLSYIKVCYNFLNLYIMARLQQSHHSLISQPANSKSRHELSSDVRNTIIALWESGMSYRKIASTLHIAKSTIADTCMRFRTTGTTNPSKRSGRPHKLSHHQITIIKRVVYLWRFSTLGHIANRLCHYHGIFISLSTLHRIIHGLQLHNYVAACKPFLTRWNA